MTMTARERSLLASSTDHEWTPEEEIQLFYAMGALKPVGVNRHFYIACIAERLSRSLNRNYSTESVWIHLRTLYNFEAVDESEPLPFPNEEKEFSLPEAEFSSLLSKKRAGFSEEIRPSCEGPPSIIAVVTDNTTKDKPSSQPKLPPSNNTKELDKKLAAKLSEAPPKRTPKRTRGSMSLESNSPSTTPPPLPVQSNKRRRI